ncbi:hypothetical protein GGX14DRAFT_596054 [Mycena pura]|uniref:Uncharacterized protein n=1 Tax=Mycena pura TaxID=153505 RepID=A0AAD6Y5D4_9AGAR|nr:hypothetical protein GGX14DRAFT_596054 [Mycena pura]
MAGAPVLDIDAPAGRRARQTSGRASRAACIAPRAERKSVRDDWAGRGECKREGIVVSSRRTEVRERESVQGECEKGTESQPERKEGKAEDTHSTSSSNSYHSDQRMRIERYWRKYLRGASVAASHRGDTDTDTERRRMERPRTENDSKEETHVHNTTNTTKETTLARARQSLKGLVNGKQLVNKWYKRIHRRRLVYPRRARTDTKDIHKLFVTRRVMAVRNVRPVPQLVSLMATTLKLLLPQCGASVRFWQCCIRTLALSSSKNSGPTGRHAQTVFEHAFESYAGRVIYIPIGIFLVLYTFTI